MNHSHLHIVINPLYDRYRAFVERIPEVFAEEGKTIYKARNEIKVFDVDGQAVNVKRFGVSILPNRIGYTWFRCPKAVRAYEYARLLLHKGIRTPEPIAYILTYRSGLLHLSYFISLQIEGETLYDIGRQPTEKNVELFSALGRYVAGLHAAEIYHADFSPGNILYEHVDGGIRFSLLDINRMRFGPVSVKDGCANFARLWGKEAAFRLMARAYAEARRADPEECTQWILHAREKFWKKYLRRHTIDFEL